MDTELLRTFLEINRTRHFGRAANNLYLTQSAISARMRLLEQTIGMPLLTRNRNDIQLTPTGRKLLPHAEAIVERWARAQQEVALHEEERASLHMGGQLSVSELIFPAWTKTIWQQMPDLALNVEVIAPVQSTTRLQEGTLDLVVSYGATGDAKIKDVKIGELELHLQSTEPTQTVQDALGANYVHVGWGSWFDVMFAKAFPHQVPGGLRTSSMHLILELLAEQDGAAYLPSDLVDLAANKALNLHPINDAPAFSQDIYASYLADSRQRGLIEEALLLLEQYGVISDYSSKKTK